MTKIFTTRSLFQEGILKSEGELHAIKQKAYKYGKSISQTLGSGGETFNKIGQLLLTIWKEKVIPDERKAPLVELIHERVTRNKNLCKIICNSPEYAVEIRGDHQTGFRRGKTTTGRFFIPPQIWRI